MKVVSSKEDKVGKFLNILLISGIDLLGCEECYLA
jgi:hypothetical protein